MRAALAGGQDVDVFAPDGFTPLGLAVFFRRSDVAHLLIEAGADPSLRARNAQQVGPVHAAVARGDVATLELLLLAGADPNAPQSRQVRPLHDAAASGVVSSVALLVLFGADPSARDDEGRTPAERARSRGHERIAARLESLAD